MYKLHSTCRACGFGGSLVPPYAKGATSETLVPVFDLGIQPLANDFRSEKEEHSGYAPLKVLFCPRCSLAQLSVVVNPGILYSNYSYVTSPSDSMLRHFENLYRDIATMNPEDDWNIMEIGSNDGAFLSFLKSQDRVDSVLGVDPAANLAEIAIRNGINTHCALWGVETAKKVQHYHPDVIIARHVFAHIDSWKEFVLALDVVCGADTLVAIEVPDAVKMVRGLEFDTVYHEHLSYVTLESVKWLLKETSFKIVGAHPFDIHGGSIVIFIRRRDHRAPEIQVERTLIVEDWNEFEAKSLINIGDLQEFVFSELSKGKRFCGYGASAKSTVMLNACHLNSSHVSFICDGTSFKQWKKSPGTGIPIVDEGALLREMPDYAIMHCWNFANEVLKKNKLYREKGGKFVIPIPELTVV